MKTLLSRLPADLSGKKILIAGGTKGTGRDITLTLAAMGAKIMLLGENQEDVDRTMAMIQPTGCESNCFGMVADPSNPEDIKIILTVIDRQFRGIDVLINNNMFTFPQYLASAEDPDEQLYSKLQGQLICTREILKRMEKKACEGYVINVNTIGKDLRRKYQGLCEKARFAFRTFNALLCKEAADKNVRVILSSV
jgi:3-oxoacyl-[acyl-carrier protein] reductase